MPFTHKESQSFLGTINNVEIDNQELYWAIINILTEIEDQAKSVGANEIYFENDFIEVLSSELTEIYRKYDDETYSSIADEIFGNIGLENPDLSDLHFNYYDMDRWFDDINDDLRLGNYDFFTKC